MPDCDDTQSVASAKEAEAELRSTFSDLLGGDGMDSFMNSVGNFMTDDEFFEADDLDVFKEIYNEYQKTPASEKQQSVDKLFESFSELVTHRKSPNKEKRKTTKKKGNNRLTNMRKELNLDEVDDEQSKITTTTSPASSAQHSTVSDASLIRRGMKLGNLGANPLGVSVHKEIMFTDIEDGPDDPPPVQSGRKQANENTLRPKRDTGVNEQSRISVNDNPEETSSRPTRNRKTQLPRSHSYDGEVFLRSSKIMMTPMIETGQRAKSRGRATTPSQSRGASQSPSRSHGTTFNSPRKSTHSRDMDSPCKSKSKQSRSLSADSPRNSRNMKKFEDYRVDCSSPNKTEKYRKRAEVRSQSPRNKQELPESPRRSRRPNLTRASSRQRHAADNPDPPQFLKGCDAFPENASLNESSIFTGPSATRSQEVAESQRKEAPRNESNKVNEGSSNKQETQIKARFLNHTEMVSVIDKRNDPFESGKSGREGITDGEVRAKIASKLEVRKRLQSSGRSLSSRRSRSSGRSKSAGRAREIDSTDERPSLSRSNSVSRRRKETGIGSEIGHSSKRQPKRMVQRSNSGSTGSVGSSSVEEFDIRSMEKKTMNLKESSSGGNRSSRMSTISLTSLTEKPGYERTNSPSRSMTDSRPRATSEALEREMMAGEKMREKSVKTTSRNKLAKESDGDNSMFSYDEEENTLKGKQSKVEIIRINPDLCVLPDSDKKDGEEGPTKSHSNKPNRIPNRSQSADDVLASRSLRRSRRPPNRNLTNSRHSTESLESGSDSRVSATERCLELTPSQRERSSRIRLELKGRKTVEEGEQRGRSASVGRSPPCRSTSELISTSTRGQTPTRSSREPRTATSENNPRQKSKPAVGMARVKDFVKEKGRSSSTPRPGRLSDRNNASFCGSLEHLNKLRKLKQAATDDDLVSVDPSVQTWDPSNTTKTRALARHNQASGSTSTNTRRRRKMVKRKIPGSQDGIETSKVSNS